MKAAFVDTVGPAETIRYDDLPEPTAGPGELLIEVKAAAVNPVDTYIRSGMIAFDLPLPFIVGCDFAGTVAAVGEGVTEYQVGDRVWGSNQGLLGRQGTFAEKIAVAAEWAYPTPDGLSDEAAAAGALTGITAHLGLYAAGLEGGETILVQGGSGGVGSMVTQLAKAAGARVITTSGSDAKVARCLELGADVAINYRTQNVADAVKEAAPQGVNVFWETQRTPDFDLACDLLAERGRMVIMAGRDARPEFPVGPFYVKELTLTGFVMFKATAEEQRICADAMNEAYAAKQLEPQIDRVLPLSAAAEAHRLQEDATIHGTAELTGKIVVTP
jgi:NADPH2:quinone reductase